MILLENIISNKAQQNKIEVKGIMNQVNIVIKLCIHAKNWFKISDEERIDQLHWSIGELFQCD